MVHLKQGFPDPSSYNRSASFYQRREQQCRDTYRQHGPPEEEGEGHDSNQSSDEHGLPRTTEQGLAWLPLLWQQGDHLTGHTKPKQ